MNKQNTHSSKKGVAHNYKALITALFAVVVLCYAAFVFATAPYVALTAPADNIWVAGDVEIDFYCNASVDSVNATVTNISLWTNMTGEWQANQSNASWSGFWTNNTAYNFTIALPGSFNGQIVWNCMVFDNGSQYNWSYDGNRTVNVDNINPVVMLVSPVDDFWNNTASRVVFNNTRTIQFNYTTTDNQLSACAMYTNMTGNWEINGTNESMISGAGMNFTVDFPVDGVFTWNVWCNDSAGNTAFNASNETINIDTTPPYINITSPAHLTNYSAEAASVTIDVRCDDAGIGRYDTNVTVVANDSNWLISFPGEGLPEGGDPVELSYYDRTFTNSTVDNITEGIHTINFTCNDTYGYSNTTSITFVVDKTYPWTNATLNAVNDTDGDGNVEISWTNDGAEEAETYRVYRYSSEITDANLGSATLLATGVEEVLEVFEDNTTTHATQYYYAVVLSDKVGYTNLTAVSNSLAATPLDTTLPNVPTEVNATNLTDGSMQIDWLPVTLGVNGDADLNPTYMVFRAQSNCTGCVNVSINTSIHSPNYLGNASVHSYMDYSVADNIAYTYMVLTADDGDNKNTTILANGTTNATSCHAAWGDWGTCTADIHTRTRMCRNVEVEDSGSCTSTPGGEGTGGGGGGGGTETVASLGETTSHKWGTIALDTETSMTIAKTAIGIKKIIFTLKESVSDVTLEVTALDDEPDTSEDLVGIIYQYLKLDLTNIDNDQLEALKMQFKVEKSWLSANLLYQGDIRLMRFTDGKWIELETKVIDSDRTYYTFEAESPGFSYFAIAVLGEPVTTSSSGDDDDDDDSGDDDSSDDDSGDDDTADDDSDDDEDGSSFIFSGKTWLFIVIPIVLIILAGAGFGIFMLMRNRNESPPDSGSGSMGGAP